MPVIYLFLHKQFYFLLVFRKDRMWRNFVKIIPKVETNGLITLLLAQQTTTAIFFSISEMAIKLNWLSRVLQTFYQQLNSSSRYNSTVPRTAKILIMHLCNACVLPVTCDIIRTWLCYRHHEQKPQKKTVVITLESATCINNPNTQLFQYQHTTHKYCNNAKT